MKQKFNTLLKNVDEYYSARLREHGPTYQGADWNSLHAQETRFRQLLRVLPVGSTEFSINDFGCGYGGLCGYLQQQGAHFQYSGFDVSSSMIESARAIYEHVGHARFHVGSSPSMIADYSVASGIFHVKQDTDDALWRDYVLATIAQMHAYSRRGFAFNCLTTYSDREKMREDLFYANPGELFDHCMRRYSRHVALLHDYGLYEFTLVVRIEQP